MTSYANLQWNWRSYLMMFSWSFISWRNITSRKVLYIFVHFVIKFIYLTKMSSAPIESSKLNINHNMIKADIQGFWRVCLHCNRYPSSFELCIAFIPSERKYRNTRRWWVAIAQVTWASVEFWNASNIFLRATTSLLLLSTAFQTIPYACAETLLQRPSTIPKP